VETGTRQLEENVHSLSLEFGTKLDFLFIVGEKLKKHYFHSTPHPKVLDSRQRSKTHHSQRLESTS